MPARRLLFLQGPCSPFWRELGAGFAAAGHRVFKIHLNLADALFWAQPGGYWYWGREGRWEAVLAAFLERHGITDILYYGDRQPYHVTAERLARQAGLRAIVLENGYLRPDWITAEFGGMGVYSRFPDDPAAIRRIAAGAPAPDLAPRYRHGFLQEMAAEVAYNGLNCLAKPLQPWFRTGRHYNAIAEYLVAIPHLLRARQAARRAGAVVARLLDRGEPFFVFALQLQGDQQIHANSPFSHLDQALGLAIASFAAHAPAPARLVVKLHPHDTGWERFAARVARHAALHGVAARTDFIDGGDLGALLSRARGVVTVNSTVGLHAIGALCPVLPLGIAIYDLPGLTHQGGLDAFWTAPEPVDAALAADFRRALAARIQVKGSFHNREGRRRAIAELVHRVATGAINGPDATIEPPPRLARARALGVPIAP